jgi:chromosomal replication initiator protein
MKTAEAIWGSSVAALKKEMTDVSFNTWIAPLEAVCLQGDTLVLQAQTEIAKKTLQNVFLSTVAGAVNKANGTDYTLHFIDRSERSDYLDAPQDASDGDATLNKKYTFDTFVIGSSNNFAHAAAKAVAENPSSAYNPLFIYGGVGLGKTHLMHAVGNEICKNNPNANIVYVTSETFTFELIESIGKNNQTQFRNKYRNADVLLVDDIQFIAGKTSTQEEFFNTFNALHTAGKQIILSSDKPPKEIVTLEERLKSRFEGGLIADIQPPDLETRIAILKRKAQYENIDIDENVLMFIAEKINSNIRQLEGSMTRVIAYAKFAKRNIDMGLADMVLKDMIQGYENRVINIDLIQQVVADYYKVDIDSLLSQRRTMEITYPRQIAMYLCKELTDASLKTIGRSFGGRDHTTVMSACRKIATDLTVDRQLEEDVGNIIKRIKK